MILARKNVQIQKVLEAFDDLQRTIDSKKQELLDYLPSKSPGVNTYRKFQREEKLLTDHYESKRQDLVVIEAKLHKQVQYKIFTRQRNGFVEKGPSGLLLLEVEKQLDQFLDHPMQRGSDLRPMKINLGKAKNFFDAIRLDKKLELPPMKSSLAPVRQIDPSVNSIS